MNAVEPFRSARDRIRMPTLLSKISWRWSTAYSYAVAIAAVMAILAFYLADQVEVIAERSALAELTARAERTQNADLIAAWRAGPDDLASQLAQWQQLLAAQATALSATGEVIFSQAEPPPEAVQLARFPEIRKALSGSLAVSTRATEDAGRVFFVALPVKQGAETLGVLRWAFALDELDTHIHAQRTTVLTGMALAALLIMGLLIFQAERAAHTVRRLTRATERVADGDLDARIMRFSGGDVGQLARAFNRMAERLQKQMRKRARERDRLNTVMHVMTDGVLILNKKGKVRLLNPAAARLLKVDEKLVLRRSFVRTVRDHRIAATWTECKESGAEASAAIELDGDRFLRVIVTPFLEGADRGYLVILQDLSRLRQLQTVRQNFVSNVSHELRTPLASLRALVETLRDGAIDDPPAAQRFLVRMEIEVDSLTQMVQELLELSRIESGHASLQLAPVAADVVIGRNAERLRPQAERAAISLCVEISPNMPSILVDETRIQQVITNLVHNAIKFTPEGGTVTVSARPESDMLAVTVADSGVGIPEEDRSRIFERFYKADRARAGGGTGLGLAIAKHIVQLHGGEIWVDSQVNAGSSFHFTVQLAGGDAIVASTNGQNHQLSHHLITAY